MRVYYADVSLSTPRGSLVLAPGKAIHGFGSIVPAIGAVRMVGYALSVKTMRPDERIVATA